MGPPSPLFLGHVALQSSLCRSPLIFSLFVRLMSTPCFGSRRHPPQGWPTRCAATRTPTRKVPSLKSVEWPQNENISLEFEMYPKISYSFWASTAPGEKNTPGKLANRVNVSTDLKSHLDFPDLRSQSQSNPVFWVSYIMRLFFPQNNIREFSCPTVDAFIYLIVLLVKLYFIFLSVWSFILWVFMPKKHLRKRAVSVCHLPELVLGLSYLTFAR